MNIVNYLIKAAIATPTKKAFIYLQDGDVLEKSITYGELYYQVNLLSAKLAPNISVGERALILLPQGIEFIVAIFACFNLGVVAVPVQEPTRKRYYDRFQKIVNNSEAVLALTNTEISTVICHNGYEGELQLIEVSLAPYNESFKTPIESIMDYGDAMIQYTSGSTDDPKGVVISHSNIIHNQERIKIAFEHDNNTIFCGWLPMYHDMGLIGNVFQPIYLGISCVLLSPIHFIQQPIRWLKAISKYNVTTSGGPNFAYQLCVDRFDSMDVESLDLSNWRIAFNGSEPVHIETMNAFTECYLKCGFSMKAFFPVYGLAESTLLVAANMVGLGPKLVHKSELMSTENHKEDKTKYREKYISYGRTFPDQNLIIVDPTTGLQCPDSKEGEICLQCDSVAKGYYGVPSNKGITFSTLIYGDHEGLFLRTGDLGFKVNGELFITGRHKETIIINGINYHPADIEQLLRSENQCLTTATIVAISELETDNFNTQIVLIIEINSRLRSLSPKELEKLCKTMNHQIAVDSQLALSKVIFVKTASLARTTSGKLKRVSIKNTYLRGKLRSYNIWKSQTKRVKKDWLVKPVERPFTIPLVLKWLIEQANHKNCTSIDINESSGFANLGIDSLEFVTLQGVIQNHFNLEIPFKSLFEDNFKYLATRIVSSGEITDAKINTSKKNTDNSYVTPVQEAIWVAEKNNDQKGAYNLNLSLIMHDVDDINYLGECFNATLNRYRVLKSSFNFSSGRLNVEYNECKIEFVEHKDYRNFSETSINKIIEQNAIMPFDLQQGRLCRVLLAQKSYQDYILLISAHHIVVDLLSFELIVSEVINYYNQMLNNKPAVCVNQKYGKDNFSYYALWANNIRNSFANKLIHNQRVKSLEAADLKDTLITSTPSDSKIIPFDIEEIDLIKLNSYANKYGTTLNILMLTLFLIARYCNNKQSQLITGIISSGRAKDEFTDTIGCLATPTFMITKISDNMLLKEFIHTVSKQHFEALDYQFCPVSDIVKSINKKNMIKTQGIISTLFVCQKLNRLPELSPCILANDKETFEFYGHKFTSCLVEKKKARYSLTFYLVHGKNKFHCEALYKEKTFKNQEIKLLIDTFLNLVNFLSDDELLIIDDLIQKNNNLYAAAVGSFNLGLQY